MKKLQGEKWMYQMLGPTTSHLKLEFALLISHTLLTISGMRGLYKDSFGLPGDYFFISLVFILLSRHLVFRVLCSWDPSTHARPTLFGLISNWLTTHVTGGQIHDRPSVAAISRLISSTNQDAARVQSWGNMLPPSFRYLWQLLKTRIWLPSHERRIQQGRMDDNVRVAWAQTAIPRGKRKREQREFEKRLRRALSRVANLLQRLSRTIRQSYVPSLQRVLLVTVLLGFAFLGILELLPFLRSSFGVSWSLLDVDTGTPAIQDDSHGTYKSNQPTFTWWNSVLIVASGCFALTVSATNRMEYPLVDLVAGGNVTKDVSFKGTDSRNLSSSHRSHRQQDFVDDTPYVQRVHNISSGSRLALLMRVFYCRVMENVLVCGIVPRVPAVCQLTGHCAAKDIPPHELYKILIPVGITSTYRDDGLTFSGYMESDISSAIWTLLSVTMLSSILLIVHALVTNRSYLAILGFLAGDWERVSPSETTLSGRNVTPSHWDPRKRYKKGDVVTYTIPNTNRRQQFRAVSDNPDVRPLGLSTISQILQSELGHPYTSKVTAFLGTLQLWAVLLYFVRWVISVIFGYAQHGILLGLVAHFIAFHAVVTVGATNYEELEQLNREMISA